MNKQGLVTLDVRESFLPGPNKSAIRAAATLSPRGNTAGSPKPSTSAAAPQRPVVDSTIGPGVTEDATSSIHDRSISNQKNDHERTLSSTSDPLYAKIDNSYRHQQFDVQVQVHHPATANATGFANNDDRGDDQNNLIETSNEHDGDTFLEYPDRSTASERELPSSITPTKQYPSHGILKTDTVCTPTNGSKMMPHSTSVTSSGGSSKAEFVFSPLLPPLIYKRLGIDEEKQSRRIWIQAILVFLAFGAVAAFISMILVFAVIYSDLSDNIYDENITKSVYQLEMEVNLPKLKFSSLLDQHKSEIFVSTTYQLLQHIDTSINEAINSYVAHVSLMSKYYKYAEVSHYSNMTVGTTASIFIVLNEDPSSDNQTIVIKEYLDEVMHSNSPYWNFYPI